MELPPATAQNSINWGVSLLFELGVMGGCKPQSNQLKEEASNAHQLPFSSIIV